MNEKIILNLHQFPGMDPRGGRPLICKIFEIL
jgi:hypothetical protein